MTTHTTRKLGAAALSHAALLAVAPAAAAPNAYVVGFNSGDVLQYDINPNGTLAARVPASAPVGSGASGVALAPDGESAYSASSGFSTIAQFGISAAGALSPKDPATVPAAAGGNANSVEITPDGASLYATNPTSGTVSQYDVDPDSGELTPKDPATVDSGNGPYGTAMSPDEENLYVANESSHTVSQYGVTADGALTPKATPTVSAELGPGDRLAGRHHAARDYDQLGAVRYGRQPDRQLRVFLERAGVDLPLQARRRAVHRLLLAQDLHRPCRGRAQLHGEGHRLLGEHGRRGDAELGGRRAAGTADHALERVQLRRFEAEQEGGNGEAHSRRPRRRRGRADADEDGQGREASAAAAGEVTLPVKAAGKARKKVKKKGKAKVTAEVTFTPDGGERSTQSEPVKLVKK